MTIWAEWPLCSITTAMLSEMEPNGCWMCIKIHFLFSPTSMHRGCTVEIYPVFIFSLTVHSEWKFNIVWIIGLVKWNVTYEFQCSIVTWLLQERIEILPTMFHNTKISFRLSWFWLLPLKCSPACSQFIWNVSLQKRVWYFAWYGLFKPDDLILMRNHPRRKTIFNKELGSSWW